MSNSYSCKQKAWTTQYCVTRLLVSSFFIWLHLSSSDFISFYNFSTTISSGIITFGIIIIKIFSGESSLYILSKAVFSGRLTFFSNVHQKHCSCKGTKEDFISGFSLFHVIWRKFPSHFSITESFSAPHKGMITTISVGESYTSIGTVILISK